MDVAGKQEKYSMTNLYRNESKIVDSVSRSIERSHLYSLLAAGFIMMGGSAWFMWARQAPEADVAAILFAGVAMTYLGVNWTFAALLRYAIQDFVRRAADVDACKGKAPPSPPGQEWDYIKVLDQNGRYKWVARDGVGGKH
jgi:trans-2-enoyl-CoA reductase